MYQLELQLSGGSSVTVTIDPVSGSSDTERDSYANDVASAIRTAWNDTYSGLPLLQVSHWSLTEKNITRSVSSG